MIFTNYRNRSARGRYAAVMTTFDLPFRPIRGSLYEPSELFSGFELSDRDSYVRTLDFRVFSQFVSSGGSLSADPLGTMMQSLHDNSITNAMRTFLAGKQCVAVMGGHKMARNHDTYRAVATLARQLARAGFTLASGGGPGAMEATHLGARYSAADDAAFAATLHDLEQAPVLPKDLQLIVDPQGRPNLDLARAAHAWFAPAWRAAINPAASGTSLAIPTWHYGHEPSTPLGSHIAKYFQNSIREDGLLAIAQSGIVFTEGKAGTTQEVFQDAAQNYYRSFGRFSPMVFLGVKYWTETLPVEKLLRALLAKEDFEKLVLFTDSVEEVKNFLIAANALRTSVASYPALFRVS